MARSDDNGDDFEPADLDGEWTSKQEAAGRDTIHEWFGSNTPSGQRGGVDIDEAIRLASRDHHDQTTSPHDRDLRKFTGCQFVAHVDATIKFDKNGDMIVTFRVPYQFKHLAIPLTDAFGIPVSIDVQIWQPYRNAETA